MLRLCAIAGLLVVTGCAAEPQASRFISGSCPTAVDDAVVELISAQQQAFADGDFAKARSFASAEFQSGVDLDQFTQIIKTQYDYLLTDSELHFSECDLRRGKAYVTVVVKTSPEKTLTYRIVPEGTTWRIDSAVASEDIEVST